MKKIAIIGTGYVGLVTGTCFAELGNQVICMDIDEKKVAMMQAGKVPIYEPGLEELFCTNIAAGRLHFTTELPKAMQQAEVVFLALPTPPADDGSADLSYIWSVVGKLGPLLHDYTVIVDKSTVPVGTAEKVHERLAASTSQPFDVVSNPEFLREGLAIEDFMKPDRVIIGTEESRAQQVMAELYEPVTAPDRPLLFMHTRSAELAKYASNSFLATKITFMNQIANLCELLGADADEVRVGVGTDKRIGPAFLYPGIGYGGSCFPKDVQALIHTAAENGYDFSMLQQVIDNNTAQHDVLAQKVLRYYDNNVANKTFALWGLAFKPQTDDIREAPALKVIAALSAAGAKIQAYDPEAMENIRRAIGDTPGLTLVSDAEAALQGADALLLLTEWQEFADKSPARIKELLAAPVVFDGRNVFAPSVMEAAGFYYESIGRPTARPIAST